MVTTKYFLISVLLGTLGYTDAVDVCYSYTSGFSYCYGYCSGSYGYEYCLYSYYYYYSSYSYSSSMSTGTIVSIVIGSLVALGILCTIVGAICSACTKKSGQTGRMVHPTTGVTVVSANAQQNQNYYSPNPMPGASMSRPPPYYYNTPQVQPNSKPIPTNQQNEGMSQSYPPMKHEMEAN